MKQHKDLLHLQNSVYAGLRTISPSKRQLSLTKSDISAMKTMWKHLGFSITPKAHLLFLHAYNDMVRFDGISDKTEDFIKKRNQDQKRFDAITHRQSKTTQQLVTQDMMEWREEDPLVKQYIVDVTKENKRSGGDLRRQNQHIKSQRKRAHCEDRISNAKKIKKDLVAR